MMRRSLKHTTQTAIYIVLALLYLAVSNRATAQTFELLHTFAITSDPQNFSGSNLEGAFPYHVICSGNVLYGTALGGGTSAHGSVFRLDANGNNFTNIHSFSATTGSPATNSDGTFPFGSLVESGGVLYGTANIGGKSGSGTIFCLQTNGAGFTNLHNFLPLNFNANSDGAYPQGDLTLSGNTLFGTCQSGGTLGGGTIFRINTDGTGFTNLHNFATTLGADEGGSGPRTGVAIFSNVLYGVAINGGVAGSGCVYRLNMDGTAFTNLHSFTTTSAITNDDGAIPQGMIVSDGTIYGTTFEGGHGGNGVIFAMQTDGNGFQTLHHFSPIVTDSANNQTNSDGAEPNAGLVIFDKTLLGTSDAGGRGSGTVFSVALDGTQFTTLYYFSAASGNTDTNSDGAQTDPEGELAILGRTVLGVAGEGGQFGSGTVFGILVPPALSITSGVSDVIISWPTNATGFVLQSSPSLGSNSWLTVPSSPAVVNDQFVLTNSTANTSMFYRLFYQP